MLTCDTGRQHGTVDSSTGYALTVTHTHAVVWPYAVATPSPESFVFTLPYPSRHLSDPLPLASLVSPSASSSEPGLVVVMPTSGKITYWESISSATTLDFMRQQRNGVEDSISGMWSSENVIQIVNAESASGFILAFSSGRMAYMSVRDAHGRPSVSVQFLRTTLRSSGGGIFGSIRNVLSHSSIQGDIAAVRSDRSSKQGEQTVVAVTTKGRLHAWKIHRGGHHDLLTETDAKEAITGAILARFQTDARLSPDSFKVHDFTFIPERSGPKLLDMSQLRLSPESGECQNLLVLTSFTSQNTSRYFLVEVLLPNGAIPDIPITLGAIRPIKSYTTPPDPRALAKPRLYLPRPAVVAFLVFERATVIASVARVPDSPDSQLMEDNDIIPATYEDVVDLRSDPTLEIVGSGIEEPQAPGSDEPRAHRIKTKNPAAVVLVRGAGTLRITTTDVERFASETPPKITAKSKLEQAVFFGIKEGNPLVFDVPRELPFSERELSDAALELSRDILRSSNPHLTGLSSHLEHNMYTRVQALEKLITHLSSLKVNLGRATKWELLWNAEKLQAARFVWAKHEQFVQGRPDNAKKDLVMEIVSYIHHSERHVPDPEKGEVDELRHFLIHDGDRMHILLAWAYEVIKYNVQAKIDSSTLTRFIHEAVEIMNGALRDALEFRKKHLGLYGLKGEEMTNGIIATNYTGLECPWTCDKFIANNLKRMVELSTEYVKSNYHPSGVSDADGILLKQMRTRLPELTEVYLTSLQELSRWALASDNPKTIELGQNFAQFYETDRHDKVVLLAISENWDAAYKLAEHHSSLTALAQVLIAEKEDIKRALEQGGLSPEETRRLQERLDAKEAQTQEYFEEYGKEFAFPYYDYQIKVGGVDSLLENKGDKLYKTAFLRTKPELARISWINDIISEDDMMHAADTLLDLGLVKEQQVWNKKIELSLGKLARMAEASRPASKASFSVQQATVNSAAVEANVDAIDKELAIIKVQDQLYGQIQPVLKTAVDETAQLPIVMDTFFPKQPKKYKILSEIFEGGITRLLKHEALDPLTLIDLLTMIQLDPELKQMIPDQFFLAIEVANNGLEGEDRDQAEQLIWRRCFLREEWLKINNTSLKGDSDVMEVLSNTELFQVFCALYTIRKCKPAHARPAPPIIVHCLTHDSEQQPDGPNYRRWAPSDVLGVYTETLDRRFKEMDKNFRERLLEAMRWEDNNLRKHVEKHRLDQWAKDTRRMAEDAVAHQLDQKTAEGANSETPTKTSAPNGVAEDDTGTTTD